MRLDVFAISTEAHQNNLINLKRKKAEELARKTFLHTNKLQTMALKSSIVLRNLPLIAAALSSLLARGCLCQSGGGVFDFGENRYGERRGTWTPSEWLGLVLVVMVILTGLALTIGLCYYVSKRDSRRTYSNPMVARI